MRSGCRKSQPRDLPAAPASGRRRSRPPQPRERPPQHGTALPPLTGSGDLPPLSTVPAPTCAVPPSLALRCGGSTKQSRPLRRGKARRGAAGPHKPRLSPAEPPALLRTAPVLPPPVAARAAPRRPAPCPPQPAEGRAPAAPPQPLRQLKPLQLAPMPLLKTFSLQPLWCGWHRD